MEYNIDENGYIIEPEELNQEYNSSQFLMITYDVMSDTRLSDFQKLLYATITGLCKGPAGYCWASNAYFQKLLRKGESQVSAGISKLVELGYIKREIVYKRKETKTGEIITTKQIAFRKLYIIIDSNQNRPIPENQNRPIPENQKEIYNPIINNPTLNNLSKDKLSKDTPEGDVKEVVVNLDNNNIINNEIASRNEGIGFSADASQGPPEEKPKPKKGGIAPQIDYISIKFPKEKYPNLNAILKTYLLAIVKVRRVPDLEKWKDMLEQLELKSSITMTGASGTKLIETKAITIVEKALNGKNGIPFTDFDNIIDKLKEPTFNLNQDFIKDY